MRHVRGIPLLLAFAHAGISFMMDTRVFSLTHGLRYAFLKVAFVLLLVLFYQLLGQVFSRYRSSLFIRNWVRYGGGYLLLMLLVMILVWPGIWRWDEFEILSRAVHLRVSYWQHFLTSVFYIFSLMAIPFPAGIVLVQLFLVSLIVGFVLAAAAERGYSRCKCGVLLLLFLLPAVVDNNFYPMRTSLYAYLELLFVVLLLRHGTDKHPAPRWLVPVLPVLAGVLATWRSESLYYFILAPLLFLFLKWKKRFWLSWILLLVLFLGVGLSIQAVQVGGTDRAGEQSYSLTALINPLARLVQEENPQEWVDAVDLVMDADVLRQHATPYGIAAFYAPNLMREGATQADYANLKKTYLRMVARHWRVFLSYRFETLAATSGLRPEIRNNIFDSSELFDKDETGRYLQPPYEVFATYPLTRPVHAPLRKTFIRVLEGRAIANIHQAAPLYPVIYNVIAVWCLALLLLLQAILKRNWLLVMIHLGLQMKGILIFLTSPSKIFMYYFPFFLVVLYLGMVALLSAQANGLTPRTREKDKENRIRV